MVLTNQLIYLVNIKTMRTIFSNYVCFSKSPNFKWQVKVKLDLAKKVKKKSSNLSKCKFITTISRNRKAPPPPMLKDSSRFQTIVSAGTNPLDQIYKNSKQRELGEKQNPLSRAYEGHCSTRLRSRSPPR
jgi:hypothetical protein